MKKRWSIAETDFDKLSALYPHLGLHPALCKLLLLRQITSPDAAQQFLQPTSETPPSPFLMKGMDTAVQRLQTALANQERLLLYGDYDVDGTSAVALLYSLLAPHLKLLDYYLPDRYREGYGLSTAGIEYAHQEGVQLIIALDCGIKAVQQVAQARAYGIDVIICDHHLPDEQLPDAIAILNPKQADDLYPFQELCGTGVAFKLAQALALAEGWPDREVEALYDLAGIATACDIVPLKGENRWLMERGLRALEQSKRPGIQALLQCSQRSVPFTVSDIVFGIGPMINAAGRLGDARLAVRTLLAPTPSEALQLAGELERSNTLRKSYDQTTVDEAQQLLEAQADVAAQKSIVLYQAHWHKGVVGIAAARLVDHYHKPTIILTASEEQIVGSARSIPGFDIHAAIGECADLLVNYGGHRYAAGLTLNPEQLSAFQERFEMTVRERLAPEQAEATISIVSELQLSSITPQFWEQLRRFAPFGPANRQPIFWSRGVADTGRGRVLKEKHLKLELQQAAEKPIAAIGFGLGHWWEKIQNRPFDICYTIGENHWRGRKTLQLQIRDIRLE